MEGIRRSDISEEYAYSGIVEAGDFVFLSFCVGNVGSTPWTACDKERAEYARSAYSSHDASEARDATSEQVEGALNDMERRLTLVGLTLQHVVKMDVLLRDPWDIPQMEEVFKRRFAGAYPARKTIATEFAHAGGRDGLKAQIDAIAYRGK